MRIARLRNPEGEMYVRADSDGWIRIEDPHAAFAEGRSPADVGGVVTGRLLPPARPLVLVGIAQNGPEQDAPVQAWLKSPRTVVGGGEEVTLRTNAGVTVAEAEIAIVIGKDTAGLTAVTAHDYILGVTAVNDLSSPERNRIDPRNFESKAGDGYTPLGPWIDTVADIDTAALALSVDGVVVAATSSRELPVPIRQCLEYVASWLRLGPGDVVMTGAPYSSAPIEPGTTVAVEVAGMRLITPTR